MGLSTPYSNPKRGQNMSFRYKGGCSGGHDNGGSPSSGAGSQAVGQPNKSKTVIGQNKEWSTGG